MLASLHCCCCPFWDNDLTFASENEVVTEHEESRRSGNSFQHDKIAPIGAHPQQHQSGVAPTSIESSATASRGVDAQLLKRRPTADISDSLLTSVQNLLATAATETVSATAEPVPGTGAWTRPGATGATSVARATSKDSHTAEKHPNTQVQESLSATALALDRVSLIRAIRSWYVQVADEGGSLLATAASASFPGLSLAGKTLLHVLLLQSGKSLTWSPVQLSTASCKTAAQAEISAAENGKTALENLACYTECLVYTEQDRGTCKTRRDEIPAAADSTAAAATKKRRSSAQTGPLKEAEMSQESGTRQCDAAPSRRRKRLLFFLRRRNEPDYPEGNVFSGQRHASIHADAEPPVEAPVADRKAFTFYVELLCQVEAYAFFCEPENVYEMWSGREDHDDVHWNIQVDMNFLNGTPFEELTHFFAETVTSVKEVVANLLRKTRWTDPTQRLTVTKPREYLTVGLCKRKSHQTTLDS